ncbi:MAG: DUF1972 domain-containing protein [Bacteroidia bacterium]|nr:DUF1972 domain-containing protein [Bacteroidia bacterium]
MRIAILGTRGIPNNYGGFEQFAEYLSKGLTELGHETFVYSGSDHVYQEKTWNKVHLIHKYNPERWMGTAGQFIYDLFCILDSRRRKFDIILQLGYTSSSVWGKLLPRKAVIVTNMDGLEWKRTKYSSKVRNFLKHAEKWGVNTSDYLVADSIGIQKYLKERYNADSRYIAYGTDHFSKPDSTTITKYGITAYNYNMLIARMEPENNIETILDGVLGSDCQMPMLVIGRYDNQFGKYLAAKYSSDERIRFLGSLYDIQVLNNLRYYSNIYFHGHSVGGTNPSLLEAMASNALVCAHDNDFNRAILGEDALYFRSTEDVTRLMNEKISKGEYTKFTENNSVKVLNLYSWENIINQYESFFREISGIGKTK